MAQHKKYVSSSPRKHSLSPHKRVYCTRTHMYSIELVEKFLLNGFQAYFGAVPYDVSRRISMKGGRMVNHCYGHNRWLNASHSKNNFSGWKKGTKDEENTQNKIRHRLISMSTIVSSATNSFGSKLPFHAHSFLFSWLAHFGCFSHHHHIS